MGQCESNEWVDTKYSMDDLKDIPIGERTYTNRGCVETVFWTGPEHPYNKAHTVGLRFPNNGEFDYTLGGFCDTVTGQNGCTGLPNQSFRVPGRRVEVTRLTYKGNPTQCCISGNAFSQSVDGTGTLYTCSPEQRRGDLNACRSVFDNYCDSQNMKIGRNDPRCREWDLANPEKVNQLFANHCWTHGPFDPKCDERAAQNAEFKNYIERRRKEVANQTMDEKSRAWCLANPGQCDVGAQIYCLSNPDSDFCACITANRNITNLQNEFNYLPICNNIKCITSGYKTSGETNFRCPNITDCRILLNLNANRDIKLDNNYFTNNCGNITNTAIEEPRNSIKIISDDIYNYILNINTIQGTPNKLTTNDLMELTEICAIYTINPTDYATKIVFEVNKIIAANTEVRDINKIKNTITAELINKFLGNPNPQIFGEVFSRYSSDVTLSAQFQNYIISNGNISIFNDVTTAQGLIFNSPAVQKAANDFEQNNPPKVLLDISNFSNLIKRNETLNNIIAEIATNYDIMEKNRQSQIFTQTNINTNKNLPITQPITPPISQPITPPPIDYDESYMHIWVLVLILVLFIGLYFGGYFDNNTNVLDKYFGVY